MDRATCHRCQGFMYPMDLLDPFDSLRGGGKNRISAWRCLSCGDLIDPVIMQNRLHPRRQRGVRRVATPRQPVFKTLDS